MSRAVRHFMPEHLHAALAGRALPLQSNIVVTRALTAGELAAHRWRNDCPTLSSRNLYYYFRTLPDGRLMLGGRGDTNGRPDASRRIEDAMIRRIGEIWPHWAGVEITHRWRGLVCFTRALRPAIGRFPSDPSVYFGFGYHGNGVNTATWTGREIARWLAIGNARDATVPEHLPAIVRGLPARFPLPVLRRHYAALRLGWRRLLDAAD